MVAATFTSPTQPIDAFDRASLDRVCKPVTYQSAGVRQPVRPLRDYGQHFEATSDGQSLRP